jgi:hypothetical protein
MTYKKIDSEYTTTGQTYKDGQPLSSALTKRLVNNADHCLNNRLKTTVLSYGTFGFTTDSTSVSRGLTGNLIGMGVDFGGTVQRDPNTKGLQFSTPPTNPICIPPVLFPLSARANKLQFTIAMNASEAPVEVYVFARLGNRFFNAPTSEVGYIDEDGIWQFNEDVKASDSYVEVGTATPTGARQFHPVQISLPVERAAVSDIDYGKHGSEDSDEVLEIFFCFHSTEGSADYTAKNDSANYPLGGYGGATVAIREVDGTYADLAQTVGSYNNPGTYHRWIRMTNLIDGLANSTNDRPAIKQRRHVVQLLPRDRTNLSSGGAIFAIYPPLDAALSGFEEDTDIQVYKCGVASIGSITIQEVKE